MSSLPFYRAAVIGCGKIGAEEFLYAKTLRPATHAAVFYGSKRIEMLALVDTNPRQLKRAKRAFPRAVTFNDIGKMMRQVRPDIVSVAVPTFLHEKIVQEIARYRPQAIICEKPLAQTLESAKRIVDVCKARKILLFMNHTRRFSPNLFEVKSEIKKIGPVAQGFVHYVRGIFNNGTHAVDLLRFYLGEVESVCAVRNKETEHWQDLKNDFNADGMLFFRSGARITIQSFDERDYSVFDIFLYGRKGTILLTQRVRGSMKGLCSHVLDCLDGKTSPIGTGEDGILALKILFALKQSAKLKGRLVRVD